MRSLNLSHNSISRLRSEWFGRISDLNTTTSLNYRLENYDVSYNRIRILHNRDFKLLVALRRINAKRNRIYRIDVNTFVYNPDIVEVDLRENRLKSIKENSFGHLIGRASLRYLALQRNPLACDCDLKWIQNIFLEKRKIKTTRLQEKRIRSLFSGLYCNNDNTEIKLWLYQLLIIIYI